MLPNFLNNDTAKGILFVLAVVNGALTAAPLPHTAQIITGVLASVFAGLGIVSGGHSGSQPSNVVTKELK